MRYEKYENGESVNENGDESGLRVEILSIVHHSRRRYRQPKWTGRTGEKAERRLTPFKKDSYFIDQGVLIECSLVWREGFLPHDIEIAGTAIDWFCNVEAGLLGSTLKGAAARRLMPRIRLENCTVPDQTVTD